MPVSITAQPAGQKCLEGGAAVFQVTASGVSLSYQWLRNGVNIIGASSSTLIISAAVKADEGTYAAVVSDNDGSFVASDPVRLEINCSAGGVPALTASSQGGYTVTASSEDGTNYAWKVFNRRLASLYPRYVDTDSWKTAAGSLGGWIQIALPQLRQLRRYELYPPLDISLSPRNWTLQGSNDGVQWTIVDTRTDVGGWTPGVPKEFGAAAVVPYLRYRLAITANQSGPGQVSISELLLYNDGNLDVQFTEPTTGTRAVVDTTLSLATAVVKAPDRTVVSVQFYANETLLSTVTSQPYQTTWTSSDPGSFNLTAVVTDDLGEKVVSDQVLVVFDPEVVAVPAEVYLKSPVNGSAVIAPAVVPIEYYSSSSVSEVLLVEALIDGTPVYFSSEPVGSFFWRIPVAGTHTVQLRATDANGLVSLSGIITVSAAAGTPSIGVGSVATLRALDAGGAPLLAAKYVWRFWDGSSSVTTRAAVQKVLNRSAAEFTVSAHDELGQFSTQAFAGVSVSIPPRLTNCSVATAAQVVPYYATLSVAAVGQGTTTQFVWRSALGKILAVSAVLVNGSNFVYTHKVTKVDEQLFLTVGEGTEWTTQLTVDLTLPSVLQLAPKVSAISTSLRPRAWRSVHAPVYCATTAPVRLSGQPTIDGVTVPPDWIISTVTGAYTYAGAARVLVRNEVNPAFNGVYYAASTRLSYQFRSTSHSHLSGSASLDDAAGLISFSLLDRTGHNLAGVGAAHFVSGQIVTLYDQLSDANVSYQINSVTTDTVQFLASVTKVATSGDMSTATRVYVDFAWVKADELLESGDSVYVQHGTICGGNYFSIVTDTQQDAAEVNHSVQIVKNSDKTIYGELGAESLDGLSCLAAVEFVNTSSLSVLDGGSSSVLRIKAETGQLAAGSYSASVSVADQSSVPGFVPSSTVVKAKVAV